MRVASVAMSLHPRNAPCPCGSGRKYKKCCLEREPELRRQAEALEELTALPMLFPLLRPIDSGFERWVAAHADRTVGKELIEDGAALLPADELERVETAYARQHPEAWSTLVADVGDDATARKALAVAAIAAALAEPRELCPHCVELAETEPGDAAEVLAGLIEPCDLWSVEDAIAADGRGDVWPLVESRWTGDHERRLAFLVERVAERLPADAVVAAACVEAFRVEARVRRELAVLLLEDAVPALRTLGLAA